MLRPDWIQKARADGQRDAQNARLVKNPGFLAERRVYLVDNRWARMCDEGTITLEDVTVLMNAWCEGAGIKPQ